MLLSRDKSASKKTKKTKKNKSKSRSKSKPKYSTKCSSGGLNHSNLRKEFAFFKKVMQNRVAVESQREPIGLNSKKSITKIESVLPSPHFENSRKNNDE